VQKGKGVTKGKGVRTLFPPEAKTPEKRVLARFLSFSVSTRGENTRKKSPGTFSVPHGAAYVKPLRRHILIGQRHFAG